ncbi:DUF2865 domain-containing protein [Salinarimonas soli]|nr:DUF2865 domain-containing protein [Salinarimonas soli]
MATPRSLRLALAFAALVATAGGALAQTAMCRQYRAELASLPAGGGPSPEAGRLAQQQLAELRQMVGYYRSLQCEQASLFGPAPECAAIGQRVRAMEANYATLSRQAQGDVGTEQRRRRLNAAIDRFCNPDRVAAEPDRVARLIEDEPKASRRSGGGRMVCVRSCDGFFFPLQNLPDGRADADTMCQALCPGSEAAAYSMPVDGDISQAVSMRGKAYGQLANALKYTTGVDRSCSCRKPGQGWADALARAEKMLARNRDDIIVTAAKAEELSRPKLLRPKVAHAKREPAPGPKEAFTVATTGSVTPAAATPETAAAARDGETAPTAGRESSGIGEVPQETRVVRQGEGQTRVEAAPTGARKVRVIAPDVVAVPRTE